MEPLMFIESEIRKLELSDIVKISYRTIGKDVGQTLPIVGFVSEKNEKYICLKNIDPKYNSRWGEKKYSIKRIEYIKKLSPTGKKGIPVKIAF